MECWETSAPKLHYSITPFLLSVNAKQLERPALQAGPSRCESDHGCQFVVLLEINLELRLPNLNSVIFGFELNQPTHFHPTSIGPQ